MPTSYESRKVGFGNPKTDPSVKFCQSSARFDAEMTGFMDLVHDLLGKNKRRSVPAERPAAVSA